MGWEWEKSGDGGTKVVRGEERNPSWLHSCKLRCSDCCGSLQTEKMTIWEEGSPQGSLALTSRSTTPCLLPDWDHWDWWAAVWQRWLED